MLARTLARTEKGHTAFYSSAPSLTFLSDKGLLLCILRASEKPYDYSMTVTFSRCNNRKKNNTPDIFCFFSFTPFTRESSRAQTRDLLNTWDSFLLRRRRIVVRHDDLGRAVFAVTQSSSLSFSTYSTQTPR